MSDDNLETLASEQPPAQTIGADGDATTLHSDPPPGVSADLGSISRPQATIEGYTLLREVARGGQGAVYEGIRNSTGRRVAIKVLTGGAFISPSQKTRFDREVQILAALEHPNIVRVIDRGTTADGSLFLVMDFISGRPLDQFLNAYYGKNPGGPPPSDPSELLRLFMKICDAVNAAHLRGIIHRDLKPSNIRICETGEPYILDFGLARSAFSANTDGDMMSMTGQFLGTLAYASPEQAEGSPSKIDSRTDVYSLGIILYQMLTRRFPYDVAGTMRDVLNNIVNSQPTPPSKIILHPPGKAPPGKRRLHVKESGRINSILEAIILKALAKERTHRYQTAGEFSRDMADYLSGKPTAAAGAKPIMWHQQLRKPLVTTAAVLGLCIVGLCAWEFHPFATTKPINAVVPTPPPTKVTQTPPRPNTLTPEQQQRILRDALGGDPRRVSGGGINPARPQHNNGLPPDDPGR